MTNLLIWKSLFVGFEIFYTKMLLSRWKQSYVGQLLVVGPKVGGDSTVVSLKSLELIFKDCLKMCNYLHTQCL